MGFQDYRLLSQLSAGSDGAAFHAVASDGADVELRTLAAARADKDRWREIGRRLRLVRLLEHSANVTVREIGLDDEPPYVVMDAIDRTLAESFAALLPLSRPQIEPLAEQLAQVLNQAHRIGIVHGSLDPDHIFYSAERGLKLDFSGLHVRGNACVREGFSAPETRNGEAMTPAGDRYALGAILYWLSIGKNPTLQEPRIARSQPTLGDEAPLARELSRVERLMGSLLHHDPAERMLDIEILEEFSSSTVAVERDGKSPTVAVTRFDVGEAAPGVQRPPPESDGSPKCLGRYSLIDTLGQGGMGVVYRAQDLADGRMVAIKVLRPDWARKPQALRRFHKEARLLAEVNNPYVANLLEVNEDDGRHFLVMELIEGEGLDRFLAKHQRLSEKLAVGIIADVSRALVDAHVRGIVHRDIKPQNILLQQQNVEGGNSAAPTLREAGLAVKLTDFGLARHVVESESLDMTQAGVLLGTPQYMAPEQCRGEKTIDARTDIYALGATLFHLLAGRPPFVGGTPMIVLGQQCNEPAPSLRTFVPEASDVVARIVEKCLAKVPDERYLDAGHLLDDLERLQRGEPSSAVVHPRLPEADSGKLLQYDWIWELEASPEQLWPHVSNTERVNRTAGLTAVQFRAEHDADTGIHRYGMFRKAGVTAAWQEYPFEWIEARRMGVLREYSSGPFKWLVSICELTPRPGGGTTLAHRVRIEPTGLLGRTLAAVEVGIRGYRMVDKIYRRFDDLLTGKLGNDGLTDPFEEPTPLPPARRQRLLTLLERLGECGVDEAVVSRFGEYLEVAPAQEIARIRPLALAQRLGVDPEQLTSACLHGAREGLLLLMWDILCPICRIPSDVKETLKTLNTHGRCEACNLDFELDFANSVEMIFRAHPEVRESELRVYCIGGPVHSPHVVAQVRVAPGERLELPLALPEGAYRLRGPQLPFNFEFRVLPTVPSSRWELDLKSGPSPTWPNVVKGAKQLLTLTNSSGHELVARVERTAPRRDALTAARAATLPLFRELFPGEILTPGQLVSVANVTLLCTELIDSADLYRNLGDVGAFALIHEHFRLISEGIRKEGGAPVKTVAEGLVASFHDSTAALRAALSMLDTLAANEITGKLKVGVAVHRGPALAATMNDHLDYFGSTVSQALQLARLAGAGNVLVSQSLADNTEMASLLEKLDRKREVQTVGVFGNDHFLAQRLYR